jgi:hypothetical protein
MAPHVYSTVVVFAAAVISGSTRESSAAISKSQQDNCDGTLAASPVWCLLKDRIPCHDLSCQLETSLQPELDCTKLNPSDCADKAAPLCTETSTCVAFGVLLRNEAAPSVEWYNATATSAPLPDNDWNFYFNTTALGPPPPPAPTCIPGPSVCPAAPAGSIFPPPGDRPPGCNHKGCATVPQNLVPKWEPSYAMNKSTIIMPCNGSGPTDPMATKGWAFVRTVFQLSF